MEANGMRIPQLKMESTNAMIAIRQTASQLNIRQEQAEVEIRQPKADLQMKSKKAKLSIDQSKAFAEANLKSALKWNKDIAASGRQHASSGTARRARQGNQLIDIHKGANALVALAKENGHPPDKMMGIKYIPSLFSVKVHYEPGNIDIRAQRNNPQIDAQTKKPDIDANRGDVSISMAQEAYLRMYVEE